MHHFYFSGGSSMPLSMKIILLHGSTDKNTSSFTTTDEDSIALLQICRIARRLNQTRSLKNAFLSKHSCVPQKQDLVECLKKELRAALTPPLQPQQLR
mmetsp:Transcript_146859/g.281546  ORF Transcript_146859/g.281546 Transcript_146859/m.281546 type:complete len:98 (+) Transcript_146859:309-602(+)